MQTQFTIFSLIYHYLKKEAYLYVLHDFSFNKEIMHSYSNETQVKVCLSLHFSHLNQIKRSKGIYLTACNPNEAFSILTTITMITVITVTLSLFCYHLGTLQCKIAK